MRVNLTNRWRSVSSSWKNLGSANKGAQGVSISLHMRLTASYESPRKSRFMNLSRGQSRFIGLLTVPTSSQGGVCNGQRNDPDMVIQKKIDNDVGEVLNQVTARAIAPKRPAFREVTDGFERDFHFLRKIKAESGAFVFVVLHRLHEFGLGLAEDGDRGHCRWALIRRNTSSEGRPWACPSRTIWTRRWISASCSGLNV